jgi:hypothetical protein
VQQLVWPLEARAQLTARVRRIGVLLSTAESDPEAQRRIRAFQQGLQELGWTEGRHLGVEYRFGAAEPGRIAAEVPDVVALKPDAWRAGSRRPAYARKVRVYASSTMLRDEEG